MATLDDVRTIALALPGAEEGASGHTGEPSWRLKSGAFAWMRGPSATDLRQLADLGREWPTGPVLAARVGSAEEKDALLAAEPTALFTIPHFDGYPAVLARLDALDRAHLTEIITDAWLTRVTARVAREWLDAHGLE